MPNKDNQLIPYPICDKKHLKTLNSKSSDVVFHHFGRKCCRVVMIKAANEQQATDCRHEIEKELSQEIRNSRCRVPDNRGGFVICKKDCNKCQNHRSGRPDSLEMEMENNGYEPVYNPGYDPLELVELRLSLESAIKKLKRVHPNYAELLSDLLEGLTIPEIALKRDKAESTVQEQIERSFLAVREYL